MSEVSKQNQKEKENETIPDNIENLLVNAESSSDLDYIGRVIESNLYL